MGEHKGWLVVPHGDKFLGRVKLPATGKYKSKVWKKEREAIQWCLDRAAEIRVGVRPPAGFLKTSTADLVRAYLLTMDDKQRSESHIKESRLRLEELAAAVPDLAAPSAPDAIENWLRSLRPKDRKGQIMPEAQLSPATRNKVLAIVRAFCHWAIRRRKLTQDPAAGIDMAAVDDALPTVFTFRECRQILAQDSDPYHRLFAVLLYTGLRIQEAVGLQWEDFDWEGQVIWLRLREGVKIKRRKERLVRIQPELRTILEAPWPASRRAATRSAPKVDRTALDQRTGPLFAGRGLNPYRGFANFLNRCNVPIDGRSPHSCRHTYASMLTAAGVPVTMLGLYLGHAATSTTAIYTQLSLRYEAVARDWPRGRIQLLT